MSTLESLESVHTDSSQPHNQKASLLSSFVLWCVLDCFTQSRAFPQTTTPPLLQPTNQNPSSSSPLYMRKLEAEVPVRGLHTKPHARPKLGCRVYVSLTPRYISDIRTLQFDSGGGVVVSSRLLSSRLVSLLSSSCLYLGCRSLSSLYQPPVSLSSCRLVSLSIRRAKV